MFNYAIPLNYGFVGQHATHL
uniref:Uncharacterized protein n=1 Tax=Anguilla anguilla TaxID=7936 RepID=A0A0E9T0K1_ANGAN